MATKTTLLCLLLIAISVNGFGQVKDSTPLYIPIDLSKGCKNPNFLVLNFPAIPPITPVPIKIRKQRLSFPTGQVNYEFLHSSFIDSPFLQAPLNQHFLHTSFSVMALNEFPLKVNLWFRQSNSAFIRNGLDFSISWDRTAYINQKRGALEKRLKDYKADLIENKIRELHKNLDQQAQIKTWFSSDEARQRLAQSLQVKRPVMPMDQIPFDPKALNFKEIALKKVKSFEGDSIQRPSLDSLNLSKKSEKLKEKVPEVDPTYQSKLLKLDTLKVAIAEIRKSVDSLKTLEDQYKSRLQDSINSLSQVGRKKLRNNKAYSFVSSISGFDIGRFSLNATDLTVRDLPLTGLNFEFNPGRFYVQTAGGKINYQFRDFISPNRVNRPSQNLFLFRVGHGSEDNNIVFTLFTGKKQLYLQNNPLASLSITGYSFQKNFLISRNFKASLEIAKSTYPSPFEKFGKLGSINDRSNEAYSFGLEGNIFKAKIKGSIRRINENFHSFNLLTNGIRQDAYEVHLSRSFFKNVVSIQGSLRNFSYAHPLLQDAPSVKSHIGSAIISIRKAKWPFLSFGVMPTQQLVFDSGKWSGFEMNNYFGSATYSTYSKGLSFVSAATFFHSFQKTGIKDSLNFKNINVSVSQSIISSTLSYTQGLNYTVQNLISLLSITEEVSVALGTKFNLQGGCKQVRAEKQSWEMGYSAGLQYQVFEGTTLSCHMDKSYIQNFTGKILPLQTGRIALQQNF